MTSPDKFYSRAKIEDVLLALRKEFLHGWEISNLRTVDRGVIFIGKKSAWHEEKMCVVVINSEIDLPLAKGSFGPIALEYYSRLNSEWINLCNCSTIDEVVGAVLSFILTGVFE